MTYIHTVSWVLSCMQTAATVAEKTEKTATKTEAAPAPAIGLCVVSVK